MTDIAIVSVILLGFVAVNNFLAAYLGMVLAGSKRLFIDNVITALQGILIAVTSVGLVWARIGLRAICLPMLSTGIVFSLIGFLYVRSMYPAISFRKFDARLFRVLLGPSLSILMLGIASSTSIYQSGSIIIGASVGVGAVVSFVRVGCHVTMTEFLPCKHPSDLRRGNEGRH